MTALWALPVRGRPINAPLEAMGPRHEAELGRACAVYPGANVGGGVRLGESVLVGSGAQVLQYLCVGTGAVIGAGAVVTRDVAREVTVVGVPAKPTE